MFCTKWEEMLNSWTLSVGLFFSLLQSEIELHILHREDGPMIKPQNGFEKYELKLYYYVYIIIFSLKCPVA